MDTAVNEVIYVVVKDAILFEVDAEKFAVGLLRREIAVDPKIAGVPMRVYLSGLQRGTEELKNKFTLGRF